MSDISPLMPMHQDPLLVYIFQWIRTSKTNGQKMSLESFKMIRHDDVTKWKHFPRYWPFLRGIHRWPVNSPHKGQWRWALMFCLICIWINRWVKNRKVGDLRCHHVHYDVTAMKIADMKALAMIVNARNWKTRETFDKNYYDIIMINLGTWECCLLCLALWLSQIRWLCLFKIWPRMPKFIGSLNRPLCTYLMRQKLHNGTGPKLNDNEYPWHAWKRLE